MSNFIIGLTGGIGSGKSTVASMFSALGINIIDADLIARNAVAKGSPALEAISEHFGSKFIQADGQLDRALLRQKVFANTADKHWLNDLLHPMIRAEIIAQSKAASSAYCIIDAPLLIENELTAQVDRVLVTDVAQATQISRTTARDNNTIEQVEAIMASQVTRQARQEHADDILNNDHYSLPDLTIAVAKLHQTYLLYAKQKT